MIQRSFPSLVKNLFQQLLGFYCKAGVPGKQSSLDFISIKWDALWNSEKAPLYSLKSACYFFETISAFKEKEKKERF